MTRKMCLLLLILHSFMIMGSWLVVGVEGRVEEKAEATIPAVTSMSPPEGNTTFLDGTTWCVALDIAPLQDLKVALDWACGVGKADCGPIQPDGRCFKPDTLFHHASYAFNNYYPKNGNNDVACYFGGTATLTKTDPSYGRCAFEASKSMISTATQITSNISYATWWKMAIILAFTFLGC